MTCVSGVVSARVVVALGPRPVAMVGALLASAGLLAARWVVTNIFTWFNLVTSIFTWFNLVTSIYYLTCIYLVQPYFSFTRDLAGILTTYSLLAGLGFGLM